MNYIVIGVLLMILCSICIYKQSKAPLEIRLQWGWYAEIPTALMVLSIMLIAWGVAHEHG